MTASSSKNLATVLGLLAVLFWSATVAVARDIIEGLGPLTAGAALYLAGGALSCLPLLVRPERIRGILRLPRAYLFGCGALVVCYTLCFFLALGLAADRAQVIEIGLINYLWPALTLLLAVPILGHRARIGLFPGVLIALAGIGLVAAAQKDSLSWAGTLSDLRSNAAPYLLALAGAAAWALYSDLSRRWASEADSGAMNLFLLAGGLVLLIARGFFHEQPHWSAALAVKAAIYVIFPIGLAYPFWDIAMRRGRMVFVASFSYLLPLLSTVVSALYLHIPLTSALWLGCALVIAGAVICKFSVVERKGDAMKVVAFNGSPRKDGNTACLIAHVFEPLRAEGVETELVQVGGNLMHGCIACYECFKRKNGRCALEGDIVNGCIEKMRQADGILLASPTYFADVTSETKALMDRGGFVARANGNFLRRKVGAAISVARKAGAIHSFDTMNHFFLISEMIVPGSNYWNLALGREKGEVEKDEEAVRTMKTLGENMAWLLKKVR